MKRSFRVRFDIMDLAVYIERHHAKISTRFSSRWMRLRWSQSGDYLPRCYKAGFHRIGLRR